MSLEKAFLADVAEHPDDDAPRLVYADWLQDHGDPARAEFIRAQVDLARPRLPGGAARRRELQEREKVVFEEHGKRWREAFGRWCGESLESWKRGFPAAASLHGDLSAVAAALPGIVGAAPIDALNVTLNRVAEGDGDRLAACPALAHVRRLWFYAGSSAGLDRERADECEREMAALLRSPHLANLERFIAIQLAVGPAGLRALIDLPRVHALMLYSAGLRGEAVATICRSPLAARLTELHVTDGSGEANARAIAQTSAMNRLHILDLEQTGVGNDGAKRLAGAAHLAALRELRLYGCDVRDAGAAAIARSPHFTKLRVINLSRNAVGPAGVRALIASTTLPRGLHLDLWDNHSTDYTDDLRAALRKRFAKVNFARSS